jgi:hypothetical protein
MGSRTIQTDQNAKVDGCPYMNVNVQLGDLLPQSAQLALSGRASNRLKYFSCRALLTHIKKLL